ncbi:hypothetical protein ASG46_06225 [Bacillus sp. Leaf49]|uniref:hypothetical protein n=1 Tax=Bacillus TaxID=1386 RepID=UPI0006FE4CE0|nr:MULTISPECIES: hypothetical protein [Bacillus]KQU12132.1 hypothetical protein ASG46_06225 [Bacillus sp. Leaf49]MCY7679875.1 hypothetical protein [Bacillus pumilus]PRS47509.1 hypothetical protein C6Y06_18330 [Bacillus sp. MZGC1]
MEQVIKRILDADVDGLKGTVKYSINEMYDVIDEEGVGEINFRLIDEFTMTFKEIGEEEERQGHSMKEEIYKAYGIVE